jgi:hypothetical protein
MIPNQNDSESRRYIDEQKGTTKSAPHLLQFVDQQALNNQILMKIKILVGLVSIPLWAQSLSAQVIPTVTFTVNAGTLTESISDGAFSPITWTPANIVLPYPPTERWLDPSAAGQIVIFYASLEPGSTTEVNSVEGPSFQNLPIGSIGGIVDLERILHFNFVTLAMPGTSGLPYESCNVNIIDNSDVQQSVPDASATFPLAGMSFFALVVLRRYLRPHTAAV